MDRDIYQGPYKVLLIADQPIVCYGLRKLLALEADFQVCGEAADAAAAVREMKALRPDLILLDLSLNGKSHHGFVQHLKTEHPSLKILAAIRRDDPALVGCLLHAGADGCIHWGSPLTKILEALRTVLRGELYIASRAAKRILRRAAAGKPLDVNPSELLSARELDVFAMIGQGLTTRQIAEQLDLSPRTIETHRKNIKMKLELQNAAQLSRSGFQWWKENC